MIFQDKSIQCSDCGLSVLRSRNFSNLRAIQTTPNAVPCAVKPGSQSDTETVATAAKCFRQYVPNVAKIPKCHLSPDKIGRCIVASATAELELVDS